MPYNGTPHWASQQGNLHDPTPMRPQAQLNPYIQGFQPNGHEMQRYQATPPTPAQGDAFTYGGMLQTQPTPPSECAVTSGSMLQMRELMLQNQFIYTKDVDTLERKTRKNSDDIKTTQEIVRNDMRVLQNQIEDLKEELELQKQQAGMLTRVPQSNDSAVLAPRDEWTRNYSKETLARVYVNDAEFHEQMALKLREQAEMICTAIASKSTTPLKLLDSPKGQNELETKAEFACCGQTYASVEEMLEHVKNSHGLEPPFTKKKDQTQEHDNVINSTGCEETPTHVTPRRAKVEKQDKKINAVEIKASKLSEQEKMTPEAIISTSEGNSKWIPLKVREMPPTKSIDTANKETFTFDLLTQNLFGEEWSPGFYFVSGPENILPSRSYWLLQEKNEPFLPSAPGQHGAKLTAFFNDTLITAGEGPDETNFLRVPVFVRPQGCSEYIYYGNYSQRRFSDKLDVEHIHEHVPESVLEHHASQLASPGRPEWLTKALVEHLWPRPIYSGPMPTNSVVSTPTTAQPSHSECSDFIENSIIDYAKELRDCERQQREDVEKLEPNDIMELFGKADADDPPGLRLWFEYLQFEAWDEDFYGFLVKVKREPEKYGPQNVVPKVGKIVRPSNGKFVKGTNLVTLKPTMAEIKETTGSPQPTASSTGTVKAAKPHTVGMKPWERSSNEKKANEPANDRPEGDMEVAKKLQQEFQSRRKGKHGGGK